MNAAARAGRLTFAGLEYRATRGIAPSRRAPRILSRCVRLCLLVVCTLAAVSARAQDLPARVGRVNDFAEVLDASDRDDLERDLAALERDTAVEVTVVSLRTLGGRGADEYAHELYDAWGLGKKGRANGVLILVAVQDHAVGIDGGEVDGLLEGILSARNASAVTRESFLPSLGTNETYGNSLFASTYQLTNRVRWNATGSRLHEAVTMRRIATGPDMFGMFVSLAAFALGTAAAAKVVVPLIALLAIALIALGFALECHPRWWRTLRGPGHDAGRLIAATAGRPRDVLRLVSVTLALVLVDPVILQFLAVQTDRRFEPVYATWIHAGIATGSLLVLGPRMWPAIAIAGFLPYSGLLLYLERSLVPYTLMPATANTVGSLTCWWLAKRYASGLTAFSRVESVVRFAACALASGAVYMMPFEVLSRYKGPTDESWPALMSAFLGIIIVTPVITLWATGARWRWSLRRGLEFAAVLAVTAVTGWFVFGNSPAGLKQYPIPFLVLPVLLWPAFRLGARETVVTTLLLSVIAIVGSAVGLGPFVRYDESDSMFLVQLFLAVCALGALAVAAEVGRREASEAEVRALNEDLEHRVSVRAQELVRAHATLRRTRVRHAAAMRHVHARIASDLHDSVGASLSRIAILSDVALRESEASATATTGALAKIGDNARAVIDEMSDAVWFVDPRMEDIQQMVVRLRVVAAALFESNGTDWGIDAGSELLPLTLTPDLRRHLFLILKEALTNVHRHAHATVVRVTLSAPDSGLRAVIEDNGTGLLPERAGPGYGNGVANMQKRARELRGTLSVQSRPVIAGTRIVVDVPLRH